MAITIPDAVRQMLGIVEKLCAESGTGSDLYNCIAIERLHVVAGCRQDGKSRLEQDGMIRRPRSRSLCSYASLNRPPRIVWRDKSGSAAGCFIRWSVRAEYPFARKLLVHAVALGTAGSAQAYSNEIAVREMADETGA